MDDTADNRSILDGVILLWPRQERSGEVRGRRATPLAAAEKPRISLTASVLRVCACVIKFDPHFPQIDHQNNGLTG
jgi:hypothetical protein